MNLTFKQYRSIDLTIMAVILAISEAVVTLAATKWFPGQPFSVSTTLTVVCIAMMRWDGYAVIHAMLGGAVYCLSMGAGAVSFVVYCAGNCGALIALLLFKLSSKERVAGKYAFTVLFAVTAYIGMQLGRWAMLLIIPKAEETLTYDCPLDLLLNLLLKEIITLLFAVIVCLLARRMDGLFEDQRQYLLRVQKAELRERELKKKEDEYYSDYNNNELK